MSADRPGAGWNGLRLLTLFVYIFMFAPIIVVVLLAFNSARTGSFPMEGFSFVWFGKLFGNDSIMEAFQTSIILAASSSLLATAIGVMAAIALIRYSFKGKAVVNNLLSLPLLMPEVVLGVALLMFLKFLEQPRSYMLLLLGHTILSLPYVVLVVQARLVGMRQHYEEAAMSLGANRLQTFFAVTLPLMAPAVLGGFLFAATLSFDNITATLFWKKPGIETVPTKIFAMLRTSISPEINALGAVMIVITVALPLAGGYVVRRFARGR
ncbi:ABC transporter permease [Dongia soli]|uniref:ABC transporter permease n=1 Tax=Dongia soli TaxID=600628 RepID=A0ABU5EHD0_9PROT|nr:ABC transporter permease [Dongia soli]MDY0885752.1 ABC transporter permease [Dongia soli]